MIDQHNTPLPAFTPEQLAEYNLAADKITASTTRLGELAHKYEDLMSVGRDTLDKLIYERRKVFAFTLAQAVQRHQPKGEGGRSTRDDLELSLKRIEAGIWLCVNEYALHKGIIREQARIRFALWDAALAQSILLEAVDPSEIEVVEVHRVPAQIPRQSSEGSAPSLRLLTIPTDDKLR